MNSSVQQVVVVGGGSAGWLTACLLAAEHGHGASGRLQVTLLESPDVGPIGVGEGTWPTMRDTLRRIGVSETTLVRECDASFKQGSRFNGWVDGGPTDVYHHPFVLPQGHTEANLVAAWLERHAHVPFADLVSFQPHLCAQGKAPKQVTTPEFAAVANYGYHFDAGKFGQMLQRHGVERLGVRHVLDHVDAVLSHDNGDIAALQTRAHGAVAGDLFVDCTGMAALLLGRHYGVPLVRQHEVLFNDRALAVQVPYVRDDAPIASQTLATAQANGWIWDIGLPTRRGVGHVYSSAHTTDDAVEQALRNYITATGGPADIATPRQLQFQPGYRREFWHRNCVAVGLSAGFVEPLEASALALAELSAAMISADLPATRETMTIVARRFNDSFRYRWERVIDFLKLHYALTRRRDTAYWRDHADPASMPAQLRDLLALWQHRPPSRHDFPRAEELFPSASYQYVLYGMGFRPAPGACARATDDANRADGFFREAAALTRRMLPALPSNRELIAHVRQHGLSRI
ncbi:MAG: tryptophan 7-halogenase [Burkholderiaceae bacterium]|nr:tryptophan 7-halogenase [Burkholderiaceae bacterium]